MQIIHDYHSCPDQAKQHVVVLGNFDGLHLGHKAVLQQAQIIAKELNRPLGVVTFDPHPLTVLRPNQTIKQLHTLETKLKKLEALGVDTVYILHFDAAFAALTAKEFVEQLLITQLNVAHVVVGYDFIFGHQRSGDTHFLATQSKQKNFGLTVIPPKEYQETPYSSTWIRQLLSEGKLSEANQLLGYPYGLCGKVQQGKQLGRQLGFPTANIPLTINPALAFGVYAVEVQLDNQPNSYSAIANIGIRPTIEHSNPSPCLEIHILDFDRDIYGTAMHVTFLEFIRHEQAFDGIDALQQQITKDVNYVRRKQFSRTL